MTRSYRFPLIVEAVAKLRSQSCIIDGEAVSCGGRWDRVVQSHPIPAP